MPSPDPQSEVGSWKAEGHPLEIEYSLAVLEEMRIAAEEGFQRIPHGGLEVGGVLFGRLQPGKVTVTAWRPVECDHARGPGFEMSAVDEEKLAGMIEARASDPELADLEPVGWFHSHTRSAIFLSPADLDVHARFFPGPFQIALVLRPVKDGPTTGGFFYRAENGDIQAQTSPREFPVRPNLGAIVRKQGPPKPAAAAPSAVRLGMGSGQAEPKAAQAYSGRLARPDLPHLEAHRPAVEHYDRSRMAWRLMLWGMVALLISTGALLSRPYWRSMSRESLGLRVEEQDGQMTISWNRNGAFVRQAARAALRVVDGSSAREFAVSADELRTGSFTYIRRAEDVEVRLTVQRTGKQPQEEITRFLGRPVTPGIAEELGRTIQERDQLAGEAEQLREELRRQTRRVSELRGLVRLLEQRLKTGVGERP